MSGPSVSDRARAGRLTRRARTIPRVVIAAVVVVGLSPVLLVIALIVDAVRALFTRAPWMASRLVVLLVAYLVAEVAGLVAMALAPVTSLRPLRGGRARLQRQTYAIQRAWTLGLFGVFKRLFRLRIRVEGAEAILRTPFVLLVRHVSLVDTLVPAVFVAGPTRARLRYVLKEELLSDPCLDIGGCRLPNFFVDRDPEDSAAELAAVRTLVAGLGPGEGAVIYPEGTRFRPDRLARALERIAARDPELHARARTLRSVLPPRPGGTLAMLEGAPDADVVVCAHHGFDGFTYLRTFWSGDLIGRLISVRFQRFARSSIPSEPRARVEWLLDRWIEIDRWVAGTTERAPQRAL